MKKLIKKLREHNREKINKRNKIRLNNYDFTIFSSNCIGGVLYHDLGLRFLSPFINMYIKPKDFIKFLKFPKKYLEYPLVEKKNLSENYPVATLNDITIYGVHYDNFEHLKNKWDERKIRINWNNIYVIMVERDGCTIDDLYEFDKLGYKNKIVFTDKFISDINSSYYIKGTKNNDIENKVIDLTKYEKNISGKRIIDKFDYVSFFNKK